MTRTSVKTARTIVTVYPIEPVHHPVQMSPLSEELKRNLKLARLDAELTQDQVAERMGKRRPTVSDWERKKGSTPSDEDLRRLAEIYGWTVQELRFGKAGAVSGLGNNHVREGTLAPYAAGSPVRRRLPPPAYARVVDYLEQLEAKGVPAAGVDEAERLMTDAAFNKLNARDPRERTEEELLMDIDDAWDFVRSVLRRQGYSL